MMVHPASIRVAAPAPTAPMPARSEPPLGALRSLAVNELVLHGYPRASRHGIADACQLELQRLFAAQPPSSAMTRLDRDAIEAAALHLAPTAAPQRIGAELAQALFDAIVSGSASGPRGSS